MVLKINDWIFDVDVTATMAYSAQEAAEHCECDYCRNFYGSLDGVYPELRPFLTQFGIDVEAPDAMSPIPYSEKAVGYDPEYIVIGKLLHKGRFEMACGKLSVWADIPDKGTYPYDRLPKGTTCFMLYVQDLTLPWVLPQAMT